MRIGGVRRLEKGPRQLEEPLVVALRSEARAEPPQEFVGVRMGRMLAQPGGQVNGDALVAKARRRVDPVEQLPVLRLQARFFFQLTPGGVEGILRGGIQLAGGNFPGKFVHGDAVLANQRHVPPVVHRHDGRGAVVPHDFPGRRFSVGQRHLPFFHLDDGALVNIFAGKEGFL